MANALGFMQMQFRWQQTGKPCSFSVTFGFPAGVDTGDPIIMETAINGFQSMWDNSESDLFNKTRLSQMLPSELWTSNFNGRVIGRGGLNQPAMQLPLDMPTSGSRVPLTGSDLLPVNMTCSGYAPRRLFLGDGSRMAVSGGFEGDWLGDALGWDKTLNSFWYLVNQFGAQGVPDFVAAYNENVSVDIVHAVVKHIEYTTPAGKKAYRLPLEPTDAAETFEVTPYQFATFSGTQNNRKRKLR